jgi:hypothetical protein
MFRVPFLGSCAGCGGFVEIETDSEFLVLDEGLANLGDILYCSRCECTGVIESMDGERFCAWNHELCTVCEAEFELMLHQLATRIVAQVRKFK